MFALQRHSSLSRIPALSSVKRLQQVTKLASEQMSTKPVTRLRQLHQQLEATRSRTFSTDTTTPSSASGHMDSGRSLSLLTQQTETPKPITEKQPRPVDSGPPVLFKSEFAARTFVLNRPSALNALNHEMIKMIKAKVDDWDREDLCKIIIGTGQGTWCAGGDVKEIVQNAADPRTRDLAIKFFRDEFQLDYRLSTLRKPYVAVLDGWCMGGGVGLSLFAPFRIATERTVFAMPETLIGYFPDVGASYFLPRLDGEIGLYLGMTGARVKGREVFQLGIATHYVPSRSIPQLLDRLSRLEHANHSIIDTAIEEFYEAPSPDTVASPPPKLVGRVRQALDYAFSADSVPKIVERLETIVKKTGGEGTTEPGGRWAEETLRMLAIRSPTSLVVAYEANRKGRQLTLRSVFEMEMRISKAYCSGATTDFAEGVDAQLLSKPARKPNWEPCRLEEVSRATIIERFFNTELDTPVPVPGPLAGDAVARDSREWAEYEARRRPDQLDLSIVGGAVGGSGSSSRKKSAGVGVGAVGGIEQHRHDEEGKTNYGLPTEEEIRAVLVRARAGAKAKMNGAIGIGAGRGVGGETGMTRKQLEMALKGDRQAMKLGVRERLDEIIERRELVVEGSDRLVWREG